jgi:hypothetical protein
MTREPHYPDTERNCFGDEVERVGPILRPMPNRYKTPRNETYGSGYYTIQPFPTKNSLSGKGACPKCNSEMVKRKGTYGMFWGCSRFPDCKGSRSMSEKELSENMEILALV